MTPRSASRITRGSSSEPSRKLKPGSARASTALAVALDQRPSRCRRRSADVVALEEELHAVAQTVVERDLGDGRIDRDLQLRPVELAQRLLDEAVVLLVGVDQQRVVDGVGGDAHVGQDRRSARSPVRPRRSCWCARTARRASDRRSGSPNVVVPAPLPAPPGVSAPVVPRRRTARRRATRWPPVRRGRAASRRAVAAGDRGQAAARRDLVGRGIEPAGRGAADEDLVQQSRRAACASP